MNYTKKDEHTLLSPAWCKRLQDAGVKLGDGRYVIYRNALKSSEGRDRLYIGVKEDMYKFPLATDIIPTYTLPELLYKLSEYITDMGALAFVKDAPFYIFHYGEGKDTDIIGEDETPIVSAARLLLQCAEKNLPYVGDISNKYK